MCSLRFENNFLTIRHVPFRFENSCLAIERVCFASKLIFVLSVCSLRFENNLHTIEGVRFASIMKKTPLSKLSFAFVSLATAFSCLVVSSLKIRSPSSKSFGGLTYLPALHLFSFFFLLWLLSCNQALTSAWLLSVVSSLPDQWLCCSLGNPIE